jgi:hypothetical protein
MHKSRRWVFIRLKHATSLAVNAAYLHLKGTIHFLLRFTCGYTLRPPDFWWSDCYDHFLQCHSTRPCIASVLAMTSTTTALPTAWLAPPEGLLPGHHQIPITPIPIAISSTIAVLGGAVVIVLFSYKKKGMFLEDHIIHDSDNKGSITDQDLRVSQIPAIQLPPPTLPGSNPPPPAIEAGPKLQAVLGITRRHDARQDELSPLGHQSYYAPHTEHFRGCDSDDETLNDEDKNSAYLPYPHSDVRDNLRKVSPHGLEVPRGNGGRSPESDVDSFRVRSPLSLESKTRLGDAY